MKHKLTQRQEEEKLSNKDMAKKLGLTGTNPTVTLLRWKNCQRIPHPKFMKQITKLTGVTPNDFYESWYAEHKI
jgi:transcriptional regulator with XRE-family HTH domain